jgi:NodT family efflux transporter outer membrane factor (OMF) lipoprotein
LWWQLFQSPALDQLVRSAIEHSPTLAAAQSAVRQAQALYDADAGGKLLPGVSGQAGATRNRVSQAASKAPGGTEYNLFNASVSVSYSIDAFGATRRELEGLQAGVDLQHWQVEAAYLTLTANLVTTAVQEASLRAQIKATQDVVASQQRTLALVEQQVRLGAIAQQAVLVQRTLLAQTQATLPALGKALVQTHQQLAVLAGRLPGDRELAAFSLEGLQLPRELPVSVPSALLRQRPDIQASEALLHAASAQVGVATANQYPQFTLSANAGVQSLTLDKIFSAPARAWSLGGSVLAPIFNGGSLLARRKAAEAAYDQALAQYQQTVLNAFLGVANALQALDSDAQALRAQAEAEALAVQSLDLVAQQVQAGAASALALLDAERSVQQTRIALAQARGARYADTAALFQALGGGWWNRADLPAASAPLAFQNTASAPR